MHVHVHNAHCAQCTLRTCYDRVVKERNSRIALILTVASKFTRFESSWLKHTAKESVYQTRITYLDELKQQSRTKRAKVDHVVITAAIH